jgi:hypothetical protein
MKLKKNAFRFPNNPDAEIPQAKAPVFIERRSHAIPTEFLIKEKGIKHKNLLKQQHSEKLESELKKVQDKVEGNLREGEVIDLNEMVDTDEYGNINMIEDINMDSRNPKQRKNKSKQMDVDHFDMTGESNARKKMKNKKKKKTKSHFIVNY